MALDPRAEALLEWYRLAGLKPPEDVVVAAMAAATRRRERESRDEAQEADS